MQHFRSKSIRCNTSNKEKRYNNNDFDFIFVPLHHDLE